MDHATAASLAALRRECEKSDVPLTLVAPAPPVTRALARLGFDKTCSVLPDLASAIAVVPSAADGGLHQV